MSFVPYGLISATEQLRGELHKSEVLLIASALLVVKTENVNRNTIKMHKTMKAELSHTTTLRNSVPRHEVVHWLHHRWYIYEHNVYSVTSEPSESSSRSVWSFKDSSALLNN